MGSMSPGGGSSIVGGRSGWREEVDCWPFSPDGGVDAGVGIGVAVWVGCVVVFAASWPSGFPPSFFGCDLELSNERGSTPFPARLAKAACLPAEGVVNGAACWQQSNDGGSADGLRRELRTAWDAAGSDQRPPLRKRCGYRKVRRFAAMVAGELGGRRGPCRLSAHMPCSLCVRVVLQVYVRARYFGRETGCIGPRMTGPFQKQQIGSLT
jgi:hypothetical protein